MSSTHDSECECQDPFEDCCCSYRAEIERLREELSHCLHLDNHNAIVRNLQEAVVVVTAEKDAEIERMRREHEKAWADAQLKAAAIEQLRAILQDIKDCADCRLNAALWMRIREALGE